MGKSREDLGFVQANPSVSAVNIGHTTIAIEEIKSQMGDDEIIQATKKALKTGEWPEIIKKMEDVKDELTVGNEFLLRGNRFVLPKTLQEKALQIAHESHAGIPETAFMVARNGQGHNSEDSRLPRLYVPSEGFTVSTNEANTHSPQEMHKKWDYVAIDFYSAKSPDFTILSSHR